MLTFDHGYALLIGIDDSAVPDWALPAIARDVAALREVLTHPDRCAYAPEHVKTISGAAATRQGILDGLAWLADRLAADASGNATAVVYYSGHGLRRGADYYLLPYDVRRGQLTARSLSAADFAAAVAALTPQRLLVILDCCHAGGMGVKGDPALPPDMVGSAISPALLMGGEKGVGTAKGLEALAVGHGRAVLSSSTGEQPSHLRADGRMSIFTYHLVEALTGHAAPQEGATEVLVSDVMGHVTRKVPTSAQALGVEQTPAFQVSGNFPIALLLGGKGLAKGQPAPDPLSAPTFSVGTVIHTGGGPYIGGNVNVGGDWIEGDKIEIHTGGGSAVSLGDHSPATVIQQTVDLEAVARAFRQLYEAVDARPAMALADKADLRAELEELEREVARGGEADEGFLACRLRNIRRMAPDIFEVALTTLLNPISGLGKVAERVAARMRQEMAEERR